MYSTYYLRNKKSGLKKWSRFPLCSDADHIHSSMLRCVGEMYMRFCEELIGSVVSGLFALELETVRVLMTVVVFT